MKHLILCREFPPAVYPPGGIGTYVAHISRLMAEAGETVHVIGERWQGADKPVEILCDGRLIVHRIAPSDSNFYPSLAPGARLASEEMAGMLASPFPAQWFSWVAAGLTERLVAEEGIDVIEGQDWEAPLYYFLLRRSLGLGPSRQPPCIVHLHSPTEFIFRGNDWSFARPDYLPMKRMEDHVIKAADAHLCPSRYLANQSETLYGIPQGGIEVIPLPLGDSSPIARSDATWAEGSICYFGRLEPRKGVIEWVEAAVEVAKQRPTPTFEFIGADLPYTDGMSVRSLVSRKIPEELADRFVFHEARPRADVLRMLGGAKMVAVPSRWENFPNTCLEALTSGLPVLATRNGGMAEMIEHGRTGWLTPDGNAPLADRLAATLIEALDTPPEKLRQMGADAATAIHHFCDNRAIINRHLEFRSWLAERGASRSQKLPTALPWPEHPVRPRPARAGVPEAGGIGVAVIALSADPVEKTLASISAQTRKAARILLVSDRDHAIPPALHGSVERISYFGSSTAAAKDLALVAATGTFAAGWIFLEAGEILENKALELLADTLERVPEAGLVAAWGRNAASGEPDPVSGFCPAFPYQWLRDDCIGPVLFRTEAIADAGGIRTEIGAGIEEWDLAIAIMANGWKAIRLPALLHAHNPLVQPYALPLTQVGTRRELIARFADLAGLDAPALVSLLEAQLSAPALADAPLRTDMAGASKGSARRLLSATKGGARDSVHALRRRWQELRWKINYQGARGKSGQQGKQGR